MTAADKILSRVRSLCRPPRRETVLQWSERERRLEDGVSSIEGRFRALPYQRLLLENVTAQRYSEHVWMIAAQTIKTESMNCVIGYFMDEHPCGILVLYPTIDSAKAYSKKKLARLIKSTRVLARKIRHNRTRDSGNTVLSKEFPGGDIIIAGSNSPASMRGPSRQVVLQDEIDTYEGSAGDEGDPCALADTRAENYSNAVYIKASTPTITGRSRIAARFDKSTRHRFHVPCPHCGTLQWLKWAQLKWPEDTPEEAQYFCESPECAKPWSDAERIRAIYSVRAGWIAEDAKSIRFGAHLSGLYRVVGLKRAYKNFLHEFAAVFLDRKAAGRLAICAWMNTFLAECYEEESEVVRPEEIVRRVEEYSPEAMPEGVLVLVAGCDVQKDRIEVVVIGYGKDEESWDIQKKVFDGDPEQDEVWNALDAFLLSEFKREDGVPLKIERAFIDMQYKNRRVLGFCAPRLGRGVYPCRGLNREGPNPPPLLPPKPTRNNRARTPHWNVGVTIAKSEIFDRLQLAIPAPRAMHFPKGFGFDADYFRQLTSEKRKIRYKHGQPYTIFEKANNAVRNEMLDANVYALGALCSFGPIGWEKREKYLKTLAIPDPDAPAKSHQAAIPRPIPRAPRRNWVTGASG